MPNFEAGQLKFENFLFIHGLLNTLIYVQRRQLLFVTIDLFML